MSEENSGKWKVAISAFGANSVLPTKAVRALCPTMTTKAAQALVETARSGQHAVILRSVSEEKARSAKQQLEEAGATVVLTRVLE